MPSEQPTNQNTKINHSGNAPEGLQELPVREFDTPLSEAFEQGLVSEIHTTADLPETTTTVFETRKEKLLEEQTEKEPFIKTKAAKFGAFGLAAAAGVATVVGLMLPKGDTSNNAPDFGSDPVATETATPGETSTPSPEVVVDANRVTPEQIAAMSPEELRDFATITAAEAPNPEAYAQQLIRVYDAWLNAGATKSEFAAYENSAKGEFENAMIDKYDSTFRSGLFGTTANSEGIRDIRYSVMNNHMLSLFMGDKTPYDSVETYTNSELTSQTDANNFEMNVTFHAKDNREESGVSEYTHQSNVDSDGTWHISVQLVNGNYSITSIDKV